MPRKTKIGTEVGHHSDTTFKVKRSKVNLQGAGHIVAASHTTCFKNVFVSGDIVPLSGGRLMLRILRSVFRMPFFLNFRMQFEFQNAV